MEREREGNGGYFIGGELSLVIRTESGMEREREKVTGGISLVES